MINSDFSKKLCQADTATRLNTAILDRIQSVKQYEEKSEKNVIRTRV